MRRKMFPVLSFSLIAWVVAMQSGCLAMRTPDAAFARKIRARGQSAMPIFFDAKSADGRKIHAMRIGADSLPTVLLVHGSPGSSDAWLDYLADTALTNCARLVAVDRPGFGYSGLGRAERSLAKQAAALLAALDSCPGPTTQKVLLAGHSLGAPLIARFAMDYPERVAGLLLVSGSIDPDLEPRNWWEPVVDNPPVSWLTPRSLFASNREIRALQAELHQMVPLWPKINCPVIVLHAQNDRLVPVGNADFARKMLAGNPDLRVRILPDGDHFILWNRHPIVRDALLEFLKK